MRGVGKLNDAQPGQAPDMSTWDYAYEMLQTLRIMQYAILPWVRSMCQGDKEGKNALDGAHHT